MLLLIAYDLHNPNRDYPAVEALIKGDGPWAHVEQSVWIVDTLLATRDWLDRLRAASADASDTFFVIRLQQDWWSIHLSEGVVEWLKDPARRW